MILGTDSTALSLAADAQGVGSLKQAARENPQAAVKETARQFEALLLNVMLKSMRESAGQDGMFDSEQTRLYTSLLDQQLAQAMSSRGIGIADVLMRQLTPGAQTATRTSAGMDAAAANSAPAKPAAAATDLRPVASNQAAELTQQKSHVKAFVERLLPDAEAASRETGIPARFLMGHAALESGWGRNEIRAADGTPSHNLFGIKADGNWQGRSVETMTTEYIDGVARKKSESFRAYDSYQEAFRDYAGLLNSRPRYAEVLKNTHDVCAYARELQEAGYATDPRYAAKLAGVIESKSLRISMTA